MYSALRLDIGLKDLLYGLWATFLPERGAPRSASRRAGWSPPAHAVVALSVRSAFDLLLSALALPRGSTVLVSAVTIPDMVRLIEAHGLRAVPLDIDPGTLLPRPEAVAACATAQTKALLIAHLYGAVSPLTPYAELCRSHGMVLIEDCAQAFVGPTFTGDADATASLFSFGPIKRATALGGAVAYVRDGRLRQAMIERQADYPVQRNGEYRLRLLKYLVLRLLSGPIAYGLLRRGLALAGRAPEDVLRRAVRGFGGAPLPVAVRRRPCQALRSLLQRRLTGFDAAALSRHVARLEAVRAHLPASLRVAGHRAGWHSYWLFPLLGAAPERMSVRLRAWGLDATRASTSLQVVPGGRAANAEALLDHVVYVPGYEAIPTHRLLAALTDAAGGGQEAQVGTPVVEGP